MPESIDGTQAWSAVAPAWDTHVDDVDEHADPAVRALLERASVQPGDRVLELAAGPGSLGPMWADLVGPAGAVVVSDVAPGMVAVARRRNAGRANVETAVIDGSAIDRADASFDVVVCRMGLMFTPDPSVALAEIHRVLRPGGRLAALTWGRIEHNPWMTCVGMAAMINGLVAGGPPTGPGGIFSLGDPAELERLAKEAGFVDVAADTIAVTFTAPTVEAHIERVSALAGPLAAVISSASPEQLAAFGRTATDLAAPYVNERGVEIPGQAVLLSARR